MIKKSHLLLFAVTLLFTACEKDFGSIEVTYTKATAIYGDLTEIRNTPLLATAAPINNPGKVFVSNDLLLIGEEEKGIHIIDNSNPSNPVNQSFLNIPGNREYYVHGDYLYAESYYDMLKIDISDKSQPNIVARIENAFASEFRDNNNRVLLGFDFEEVTEQFGQDDDIYQQIWSGQTDIFYFDYANRLIPPSQVPVSFAGNSNTAIGSVNRIAYAENHVYVISRTILTTFDDTNQFTLISSENVGWNMETIYPNNGQLFIGTMQSMEIFDITNPSRPNFLSSFFHATSCDPVLPCDDVAYVTLRTGDVGNCPGDENALLVVDIRNPHNPQQLQAIEMESPFGMSVANSKLYVGEGSNGLKIFDITDKENIRLEVWDKAIEAYDIILHPTLNNFLLVAGPTGISQYEIEDVETLSLVSTLLY